MSQTVMGGQGAPAERLALGGRTASQGMFGGIALVLGIVGLAVANSYPGAEVYLNAIAQISLGLSLIVFGMTLAMAYIRVISDTEPHNGAGTVMGTTADMFLGGAVVIIGVLALVHIVPHILIPAAAIVVGIGLLLNSAASIRAATLETEVSGERTLGRRVHEELVFATASVRAVAGVAVSVLGILGLTTSAADSMLLTLAAAIVAGAAMLLASTSLSGRFVRTVVPHTA
jgi:hypothetical protein